MVKDSSTNGWRSTIRDILLVFSLLASLGVAISFGRYSGSIESSIESLARNQARIEQRYDDHEHIVGHNGMMQREARIDEKIKQIDRRLFRLEKR